MTAYAEKRIAELELELLEAKRLGEDAAYELIDAQKLIEERDEKIDELSDTLEFEREQADALVKKLEGQIDENYKLIQEYVAQRAEAEKLVEQLKATGEADKATIAKLEADYKTAQDKTAELLADSTKLREDKAQAEEIARKLLLERATGAIAGAGSVNPTELQARISELEQEAQTRQGYLRKSADELKVQTKLNAQNRAKVASLTAERDALASENEGLATANADLTAHAGVLTTEIEAMLYDKVRDLIFEGFGVETIKSTGKKVNEGKLLWKAVIKAQNADKKAEKAFESNQKKAKKKGRTVLGGATYTEDGMTMIIKSVADKYEEYLKTNKVGDEAEREFESKFVTFPEGETPEREVVVKGVLDQVIDKETASAKSGSKVFKIVLTTGIVLVVFACGVATYIGISGENDKAELRNDIGVKDEIIIQQEGQISTEQAWAELEARLTQLHGEEIHDYIVNDYNSILQNDQNADKINAFLNPNSGSAQAYKTVGGVSYFATNEENVTDYLRVKKAVSASEGIKLNADNSLTEYTTAMTAYAEAKASGDLSVATTWVETAESVNSDLNAQKVDMTTQADEADLGVRELLVLANMTMEEIEYIYSLMQEPVIYVDINDEQQILNNNTLFTFNDDGRALSVITCAYDKKTNRVDMIVECMGANRQKYFNYVTFQTANEYELLDQYELIEEMKTAQTTSVAYDKELETDIEGTNIQTQINGVDVEGIVDLKWSLSKKVDKKSDSMQVKGNAIVVLTNEAGEFVGFKMFNTKYDFSASATAEEVEEKIKQLLLEEINKELGTSATLVVEEIEVENEQ